MMNNDVSPHDELDALCSVFDTKCIQPNDIFLITGNDDVLANAIMISICQQLQPYLTFVNVYTAEDIQIPKDDVSYEQFIPETCIFRNSQLSELESFLHQQTEMIKRCMTTVSDMATRQAVARRCQTLLILDRCPSKWLHSQILQRSIQNRHTLQLTLIVRSTDSITKIPPVVTQKVDFCFVLSASVGAEHNKLFNTVAGFAPAIRDFRKI